MKFKRKNGSRAPQLALTSMLDVIFLLLCFFVTASVFSQWENEISIKLPSAATAEEPDRLPGEIVLNLDHAGKVSVNGKELALADLGARLAKVAEAFPGQAVIIRADKSVAYEALVGVIDTCRGAGIWNFSLATQQDTTRDRS